MVGIVVLLVAIILSILGAALSLMIQIPDFVDCVILGIVAGMAVKHFLNIHSAFCLLIGIVVCLFFIWVVHTRIGFWIITIPFAVIWGGFCSLISMMFTEDKIWLYTIFGIATVASIVVHIISRDSAGSGETVPQSVVYNDNSIHLHYGEQTASAPKEVIEAQYTYNELDDIQKQLWAVAEQKESLKTVKKS